MTGECNYGGRVTDERDRRCLITILRDFLCPTIVTDARYKFSPSGLYFAPHKMEYSEYLEFIKLSHHKRENDVSVFALVLHPYTKSLPATQNPEVFGMHENVDITRELSETRMLTDSILLTVGQSSSGGGGSGFSDSELDAIASDILGKIPATFDMEEANKKYPVKYEESMNTVLVQEMERFNKYVYFQACDH
ncbi:hypothetical protein PHET_12136 [Paragonimus heterotremus]|uniref:Uncharacterized protein n=1 Tax=Paragonimus heterotremus TaxID=100268 RepID=A0A8J4WCM5_9TREM|nr:hypothetical protein PHET_12136 [Paragonimus heterotremus]